MFEKIGHFAMPTLQFEILGGDMLKRKGRLLKLLCADIQRQRSICMSKTCDKFRECAKGMEKNIAICAKLLSLTLQFDLTICN